jgi:septal ring factor EnvC (AmiA/AmiB activator)
MIFTQRAARERIESLESRNTELEAELAAESSQCEALRTELATANETILVAQSSIAELDAAVETLQAQLTEANASLTTAQEAAAQAEQSAAAKAVALAAEAGIESPLPITASEKPTSEVPTLTRAEFNKLPPSSRLAHVRAGGKLTD